MNVKRARLIYNPTSGRETVRRRLPDILDRLERGGLEVSTHATRGEGDAVQAAALAVERGFDVVIAAGGDGTLHEVVNGLAEKSGRPPLGILPLGTTNDFARALGIPRRWDRACDVIVGGRTLAIDIGKVNDKYFLNTAGGGSLTELTYEVPIRLKTAIGQLAYYVKGLEKLPRLRPITVDVEAGDRRFREVVMLFLVCNSNSVAGFERLAPEASIRDGMLDVFLLKKCNLADFLRVVSLALRGEHLGDPHLVHFRADRLQIVSPDHVQLNLDGEFGGTLPCTISVLPRHLDVIVNPNAKPGCLRDG